MVTATHKLHAISGQSGASDELHTINGGLTLYASSSANTVTVTEAGNIELNGTSFALGNAEDSRVGSIEYCSCGC